MSTANSASTIAELRRAVTKARSDSYLVEARVIRRIIRELHGFARLTTSIPHDDVLVAEAEDIRLLAHPDELGLEDFSQLNSLSVLVAQPEEYELDRLPAKELFQLTWKRLFHGCIDMRMRQLVMSNELSRAQIQDCIDQVGQVEFDEAHAVLRSEHRVVNSESHVEAYCEFVAIFLQLNRFSADLLPVWFPSLANGNRVLEVLRQHVDDEKVFGETQLQSATMPDQVSGTMKDEARVASDRRDWTEIGSRQPSSRRFLRLTKKRIRWAERGNTVASAVCAMQAAEAATTSDEKEQALVVAKEDVGTLAIRLHEALEFPEADLERWRKSLWELLQNSTRGFWNSDKRLLYDLQKVCLDHERTIYQIDLVKWIVSRGKRPLRRPLNNLREVMMAKHLASSSSRLVNVRLSGAERAELSNLIHTAAQLAEHQMRLRMRSSMQDTIRDVGLQAKSVPEKVAFDKMVEESLDCITERGYLTMGYLRDAISRNDLKLPDLMSNPKDLIRGDHLLRTDDRLDVSLDGVYRRGEFYLRWLQVVSSIAFGTHVGRFITLFLAIPFGGAVVIVVGTQHLIHVIRDFNNPPEDPEAVLADGEATTDDPSSDEQTNDNEGVEGDASTAPENSEPIAATEDADETAETTPDETAVANADDNDVPSTDPALDSAVSASAVNTDDNVESEASTLATANDDGITEAVAVSSPQADSHQSFLTPETVWSSVAIGFLLMAIIHLPRFRGVFWNVCRYGWKLLRTAIYDVPLRILSLPAVRRFWRSRLFTRIRRVAINPFLLSWIFLYGVPKLFGFSPQSWGIIAIVTALLSAAVNSRLGRDAEELASEWLANVWHDLRSRLLMALYEWTLDVFKWLLSSLERFIYAVDEWLRFHSGETWLSIVAKAFLGVIWGFFAFLIRIYVNLLIEPTLHPVKHFPVVTVAHKIFLPFILQIRDAMQGALTPHVGPALAETITWFNILFLPGIFGFLVWELKENWRLYASNRERNLRPVVIGSHGENGARLLKPGFHSGTLPKLFGRLRRLEQKEPSFHRFCERRAHQEALEHAEQHIKRFVERDLIRVLTYCKVWEGYYVRCRQVHAASNSFLVELECETLDSATLHLLFQEQSGWLVATVSQHGWLDAASPEQMHSFETALRGFYCKAGVDLVREQIERQLVGTHPYDISADGLKIWPERQFDRQIICDLHRRHQIRPWPPGLAASYGLQPVSRDLIVYSESSVRWIDWQQVWAVPEDSDLADALPLACLQSAQSSLLRSMK